MDTGPVSEANCEAYSSLAYLYTRVHKSVDKVQQEDCEGQHIRVDNGGANDDRNIIQADGLEQGSSQTGPEKDSFRKQGTRPQTDDQQRKICDDIGQCGPEDIRSLNIARGQSLGLGHIHIIFTGVDQEERTIVINAQKERTEEQ